MEKGVQESIFNLIEKSCLLCWVISENCSPTTTFISNWLKRKKKRTILLVNGMDKKEGNRDDYVMLGVSEIFFNLDSIVSFFTKNLSLSKKNEDESLEEKCSQNDPTSLSIVITGLPNAGKSTLMNLLLKQKRSLVSPLSGTTIEPVSADFYLKESQFCLIDTLGVLKEREIDKKIWNNCQILLIVIDVTSPISKQILKVISLGIRNLKPSIIIVNKIDLVKNPTEVIEQIKKEIQNFFFCYLIATCFLKECQNGISRIIRHIENILDQSKRVFSKKKLNFLVKKIPCIKKTTSINYIKQLKRENELINCFVFFVNRSPQLISSTEKKFLTKWLQSHLEINSIPVLVFFKKSKKKLNKLK